MELCELKQAAIRLLATREHSQAELRRKLTAKADSPEQIEQLLQGLVTAGYQSDQRFAEQYIDSRMRKGFGPIRIRAELQERGIDAVVIEMLLDTGDEQWRTLMREVRQKRFGAAAGSDYRTQARQARFLEYRGFPAEWVRQQLFDSE